MQWTQTKRSTGAGGASVIPYMGPMMGELNRPAGVQKKLKIVQKGHVLVPWLLVPWLISKHGLSYKTARMGVVMQMVEAIIDQENLPSCEAYSFYRIQYGR